MSRQPLSSATRTRLRDAWAVVAGIEPFPHRSVTVFVDAASPIGRHGWVCMLAIDEAMVAAVPRADFVAPLTADLQRVGTAAVNDVGAITAIDFDDVLGPAKLAYVDRGTFRPVASESVGRLDSSHPGLAGLVASLTPDEVDESGAAEVATMAECFAVFEGDQPVSVCGYRVWNGRIAHLYAFTHGEKRRRGLAASAASAAVTHALDADLLPQWRARFDASRATARGLGFEEVGGQLSLRPSDEFVLPDANV